MHTVLIATCGVCLDILQSIVSPESIELLGDVREDADPPEGKIEGKLVMLQEEYPWHQGSRCCCDLNLVLHLGCSHDIDGGFVTREQYLRDVRSAKEVIMRMSPPGVAARYLIRLFGEFEKLTIEP